MRTEEKGFSFIALKEFLGKLGIKSAQPDILEIFDQALANYGIPSTLFLDVQTYELYKKTFISPQKSNKE